MESFWNLKRKLPPLTTNDSNHRRNTRPLPFAGASRLPAKREVNLNKLPYDRTYRKRIIEYIGPKLQDEIRRKYLIVIRDDFVNYCIICFLEQRLQYSTPCEDVTNRFLNMKDRRGPKK
jgi:hypothetical protein